MSFTEPMPSQRGHMPPARLNTTFSALAVAFFSTVTDPTALIEGTLKEKAFDDPICGLPSRLHSTRSIAFASVAVPTVERALAPIRS